MSMTRKHFKAIARVLKDHKEDMDNTQHIQMCFEFAGICAESNTLFDCSKFLDACGLNQQKN